MDKVEIFLAMVLVFFSSIITLSWLLNADITSLRGFNLTLSGTLTTSGIVCCDHTSISGLLDSYNELCKHYITISGYMTVSGAIYCNNAISTGLISTSSLNCKNRLGE